MSPLAASLNIRISSRSKEILRQLAKQEGKPMQTVLDEAIEQYRRDQFFKELNAGYASLQSDAEAWNEELTDRQSWDGTLLDGI